MKDKLFAVLALAILLHAEPAGATTRTVTSLNDDGGAGTLRALIVASAANDTINFAVTGTIILTNELPIGRNLTISGPGAKVLTVSGNNASRVFNIIAGTVNISNLAISNGHVVSPSGGGGGIYNGGTLTINNCTLSGDTASSAHGGGIYNGGVLTVNNCTLSGNNTDAMQVGVGNDGGIHNFGTLTINNCTFSGNSAGGFGYGGAIFNENGSLTIKNCTLSGNSADRGGGIYNGSSLIVLNTIIANNSVGNGYLGPDGPDVYGAVSSQGHNLIGASDGSSGWVVGSDLLGSIAAPLNPLLGPLQDNGGPTFTMAPLPGSAAIDAGDDSVTGTPTDLFYDQRGRFRWIGAHVDIGAVEVGPVTFVVMNANDSGAGSLRQAISDASFVESDTVTFAPNVTGVITLISGELAINKSVKIVGPGARVLTISGNNASRVFHISGGAVTMHSLRIANGHTSGGGGGLLIDGGIVNLYFCAIANCYAQGVGVGGAGGGGIAILGGADLGMTACTLSGNTTPDYGGGLYLFNGAYAYVLNSTISGNSTLDGTDAGWGGGVFVQSSGSTLSMFNSTVASNSRVNAGGGIYRYQGTVTLADTLVAGNSAPSGPDCKGTFVSSGYNLIGNSSASTGFGATGDQLNVNPLIGPLADNGGPTFTHALLTGSPAIDKGNRFGVTTDQRGLPRPYDDPAIGNGASPDGSDIGAFELQAASAPRLTVTRTTTNTVAVFWPSPSTGFSLQQNTNGVASVNWSNVTSGVQDDGTTKMLIVNPPAGNRFFRLKQ